MSHKRPLPVPEDVQVNSTAGTTSLPDATGSAESEKHSRATGSPRAKKPKLKTVAGTYWRADGDGWELRKSGGANDPDKDKYLGRLSGKAYARMKADNGRDGITSALTEWAKAKAAQKGIDLNL